MSEENPIIKPERIGLWTAATFIVALLALAAALVGVFRVYELTAVTQGEFLILHDQVGKLQSHHPAGPANPQPPTAP